MSRPDRLLIAALLSIFAVIHVPGHSAHADGATCSGIDTADVVSRLACRVTERAGLMQSVATYKAATDHAIYDAKREAVVLGRVEASAAEGDKTATLLFAQIQMDLAKALQAAWIETTPADKEPPSLESLRASLNVLGDAVASDLAAVRARAQCPRPELETALAQRLTSLESPLDPASIGRHARMLAAAACAPQHGDN